MPNARLKKLLSHFPPLAHVALQQEVLTLYYYYPWIEHQSQLTDIPKLLTQEDQEFCFSFDLSAAFITAVCQHGFLPMATQVAGKTILLIKLHQQRCVLHFENLHIPKTVRRRSKHLSMTINQDFKQCVQHISQYHEEDNWLYPEIIEGFIALNQPTGSVKTLSFEVWDNKTMVAGEIGYYVGSTYSSLSGFYHQNSAGSIQLCATGQWLQQQGFAFWDLGMDMDYKQALGATLISRQAFLKLFHKNRQHNRIINMEKVTIHTLLQSKP